MSKSNENTSYKVKYAKEKYKRVPLDLKKQDYEELQAAAEAAGEKVNAFIKQAIADRLKAMDSGGKVGAAEGGESLQGYMPEAVSRRMQQEQDEQDIPSSLLSKLTTWLEEHRHSREETLDCISFICEER